ncbi:MAG: hypothetical protein GIW97_09290 [Candidatus Eremiobacteraeota bacterium]|nr:hypothetical protein [Candidatus Eremiobacteraeota bacterium]
MQEVKEQQKQPSPAGRPFAPAFLGTSLWFGSWDTGRIYETDPKSGAVRNEFAAPGKPFGLAALDGELRVVTSNNGVEDDRYLYRLVPGTGFDLASKIPCPDLTGSHLAVDGGELYLAQLHNRRILVLSSDGTTQRKITLPSQIAGMGFRDGKLYVIAADEDFEDLRFATLSGDRETPQLSEIAKLSSVARCLAFDGQAWWTSYREENEIVSFTV